MEYVIEKGVPLPQESKHAVTRRPWDDDLASAFSRMDLGDSLVTTKTLQGISSASARSGVKVTSRKEGGAYRVWRSA